MPVGPRELQLVPEKQPARALSVYYFPAELEADSVHLQETILSRRPCASTEYPMRMQGVTRTARTLHVALPAWT